jgi:Protein of Unknown function (DUF2784)
VRWAVLADVVLVGHFSFALFVALGGLLLFRFPRIAWIHLPCLAYGAAIEVFGWICPLTPLEQRYRLRAGQAGYEGGFLDHYVGGVLYPENWPSIHVWFGVALVAFNAVVYGIWIRRSVRRSPPIAPRP